jgi:hypothetical protein
MTGEQEQLAQRVAAAKHELRSMMQTIPKSIIDGGSTRVIAWKSAINEAQKTINRASTDPSPYLEAIIRLRACSSASVEDLVTDIKGWGEKK